MSTQTLPTETYTLNDAFHRAQRKLFVLPEFAAYAHDDTPLPIGFGQTISQPTTVRLMLEWLEVEPGDNVLDVGSGSGWTTALLSYLVGTSGHVYAVDIVPELVEMSWQNCQKFGDITNVECSLPDAEGGLAKHAPYDRILVSASANTIPPALLEQLAVGGKMVIPVGHEIMDVTKTANSIEKQSHYGFTFVPYDSMVLSDRSHRSSGVRALDTVGG